MPAEESPVGGGEVPVPRELIGHLTSWEPLACEGWRAALLGELTGLATEPYRGLDDGGLVPPTFLISQSLGMQELGLPDAPVRLNGGNGCRWEQPVRAGDRLERQTAISDITVKDGRSGRLVLYQLQTTFRRAGTAEVVARSWNTAIRRYPRQSSTGAAASESPAISPAPRPSDSGPEAGPATHPGGEGAVWVFDGVATSRDLVRYAAATGDYYEAHYDQAFARRSGLPDVIVHGLYKLGWLARGAAEYGGGGNYVREIDGSYRGIDLVGRSFSVWCEPDRGRQEGLTPDSIALRLYGVSEQGAVSTVGTAVIEPMGPKGR